MNFRELMIRATKSAALGALWCGFGASGARAATIPVSNLNDSGGGSLRQAIASAAAGDTINFQPEMTGTITLTSGELALNKSLIIQGTGADKIAISGNYARRIFNVTAVGATISGLKILNGDTSTYDDSSLASGGAIRVEDNAFLTLNNSVLEGNTSGGDGGAIYNAGTLFITNSNFTGNTSTDYSGGAILNDGTDSDYEGALQVRNCNFISNSSNSNGGAVYNYSGSLQVSNSNFSSNFSLYGGGAILNDDNDGTATITDCIFNSNYQTDTSYRVLGGGGVWTDGRLVISGSTFVGNQAYQGGGVCNYDYGILTVTDSTFSGNSAGLALGGGIRSGFSYRGSTLSIDKCTIDGNNGNGLRVSAGTATIKSTTITANGSTEFGGGLYFSDSTSSVFNCTITGNNATKNGGGIYRASGTVNLRNSIVAQNTVNTNGQGPDVFGSINSQNYNLFGDVTGATFTGTTTSNVVNPNPLLGELSDNGGPTQTIALLAGSPAIDKGFGGGLSTDQRGLPRLFDNAGIANAPGGDGADIGAFESQSGTPVLPSLSIGDVNQNEGNSPTNNTASFTVTLSKASSQSVSVAYAAANGGATAGSDFTATSGTLTIPAGQRIGTISVPIVGDTAFEKDENFVVNLSSPTNATIALGQGVATLLNDDVLPPTLSVADVSVTEGNSGPKNFAFTVTLSAIATTPVTVKYTPSGGTATAGSDFSGTASSITIPAGTQSGVINVPVLGDTTVEGNETFGVTLSEATGATLADASATGTIQNDDAPTISIAAPAAFKEGDAVSTQRFTVSLSGATPNVVSVALLSKNGTASAGNAAPSDYQGVRTTLTFAPGETSKIVEVNVFGDKTLENDETFSLVLSAPQNAVLGASTATTTIQNDDVATYFLSGKVVQYVPNSAGRVATVGIAGVTVARLSDGVATTKTDARGGYLLKEVPAGEYILIAYKAGLPFEPRLVKVTKGNISNLIFQTHTLYGQVYRVENRKTVFLAGVSILVNGIERAKTDANGRYSIINLAAGDYALSARANGLVFPEAKSLSLGASKKYLKLNIAGKLPAPAAARQSASGNSF